MSDKTFNVAMIGLGFGAEFIPIYQEHPNAHVAAICRRNEEQLNKCGDQFGIDKRYTKYEDVLADPDIDYVHINSPIPDHASMSLQALDAGKHVMCTVPMATTIEECRQIVDKVKATGLKYMMAETVVYSREFLFIKEMYEKGELGKIQHLAASHPQDMDGWPSYWEEMIPMHYATHVVSPCLGLTNSVAEYVSCFGSGAVREDIAKKSGNKYAVESCHIKLKIATSPRTSGGSSTTWLVSIARALMCTERRRASSGLWLNTSHTLFTPRKFPNRRSQPRSRFLTSPICYLRKSVGSQCRRKSTTPTTCPSSRVAGTEAPTHTWSTKWCRLFSKIATHGQMPCSPPTGPASASAPTSPPKKVANA